MVMRFLRYLLFPITLVYLLIYQLRNFLYNIDALRSFEFNIPIIGVGNLAMGGTGKTPHTEFLIQLLEKQGNKVGIVSRGYGRKTRGFVLADENSNAQKIGDEPYQMFLKFPDAIVAVCENRAFGIKKLLELNTPPDIIVLDDAFQHRTVKVKFHVLLSDINRPFYQDHVLPMGNLREAKSAKERADLIVMTKCNKSFDIYEQKRIETIIKPSTHQEVVFSYVEYQDLVFMENTEPVELNRSLGVLMLAGIANPIYLQNFLSDKVGELENLHYPDHYNYNKRAFNKIKIQYQKLESKQKLLITTEKDYVRLLPFKDLFISNQINLAYLPIKIGFNSKDQKIFQDKVIDYVIQNRAKRKADPIQNKF